MASWGLTSFSTSELLYPIMKNRLQLIRARPNFYMISDNPNVSLATVDCFPYTRPILYTPIRRVTISVITNYAFTGSVTENPFRYQQFDPRRIRILRGGQPVVDFDTANNCRLNVTTMKAINFQDAIPSIPIDDFKEHYVLVFELTSKQ